MAFSRRNARSWKRRAAYGALPVVAGMACLAFWYTGRLLPPADAVPETVYRGIGKIGQVWQHPPEEVEIPLMVRSGNRFHPEPVHITSEMRKTLELLKQRGSYRWRLQLKCLFHADFEVDWQSGSGPASQAQVCLSCGEVLLLKGNQQEVAVLTKEARQQLKEAWLKMGMGGE